MSTLIVDEGHWKHTSIREEELDPKLVFWNRRNSYLGCAA